MRLEQVYLRLAINGWGKSSILGFIKICLVLLRDIVFYIVLIRYLRLTIVTGAVIVLVGSTIIDVLTNEELTLLSVDLLVICACSTVQVGPAGTVMLQRDLSLRPGTVVVKLNMLTFHILFGLLLLRQLGR